MVLLLWPAAYMLFLLMLLLFVGAAFSCPRCLAGYSHKRNLQRHLLLECGQPPRYQCPYCPHRSKRRNQLIFHIRRVHHGYPCDPEQLRPIPV